MVDRVDMIGSSIGIATLQPSGGVFAKVTKDGRVLIDWPEVERAAATALEPMTRTIARLMLAVRSGKWEPMPREDDDGR